MIVIRFFLAVVIFAGLGGCASFGVFNASRLSSQTNDVEVTGIVVSKGARRMYFFNHGTLVRSYQISLGSSPVGDKKIEGDGKTPEGLYRIDRKNPNSKYFLSLGISYPNKSDIAEARTLGQSAGGDIFIHGEDQKPNFFKRDWTAGCIAVRNNEMQEIYRIVEVGTPIQINP